MNECDIVIINYYNFIFSFWNAKASRPPWHISTPFLEGAPPGLGTPALDIRHDSSPLPDQLFETAPNRRLHRDDNYKNNAWWNIIYCCLEYCETYILKDVSSPVPKSFRPTDTSPARLKINCGRTVLRAPF